MSAFPVFEAFVPGKPLHPEWKLEHFFDLTAHEEFAPLQMHIMRLMVSLFIHRDGLWQA